MIKEIVTLEKEYQYQYTFTGMEIEITKYECSDGKIYRNKEDALTHETRLAFKKIKSFYVDTFPESCFVKPKNTEELNTVFDYMTIFYNASCRNKCEAIGNFNNNEWLLIYMSNSDSICYYDLIPEKQIFKAMKEIAKCMKGDK